MSTRLYAVSLALLLSACATHDDGAKPGGSSKPVAVKPEAPKPEPLAEVTVAVASVQLIGDCPDPASEAAPAAGSGAAADAAGQAAPVVAGEMSPEMFGDRRMAGKMAPGATWTPPCTQSTMQLALRNPGKQDATLQVVAVRLVDVGSKKVLGPIAVRKPSVWSGDGVYRAWDEKVAVGADLKIAYRLGAPDWSQVEAALGAGLDLYAKPFVLEVDVAIDGVRQTVRSPEFVREHEHMIAT